MTNAEKFEAIGIAIRAIRKANPKTAEQAADVALTSIGTTVANEVLDLTIGEVVEYIKSITLGEVFEIIANLED